MTIAMIVPQIRLAGAEKVTAQLACAVNGADYRVHLLVINEKKKNIVQDELDAKLVRCHFYGRKEKNCVKRKIRQLKWIFRTLDRLNPDVIHTNLDYYFSWIYALVRGKQIVTTFHTRPLRVKSRWADNLWMRTMFRNLHRKKLITGVLLTESGADEFSRLSGVPREALSVVANPVEVEKFRFPGRTYEMRDEIVFTFVARFDRIKNHHMLIAAFYELLRGFPDCRLILAGSGSLLMREKEYARVLGIENKVSFPGEVHDVPGLLARTDVCVISSVSESFSLVLVEAMASGLPVVVTDVGGMRDIVDGNGIKVSSGDVHGFAEAMKKLAADGGLRRRFGCRSLELAQKYDIGIAVKKYKEVYNGIKGYDG